MTSRPLLRMAFALPVAAGLISCGGSPTATGPAAHQVPVGTTQVTGAGDATSSDGATAAPSHQVEAAPTGARPGAPGPGPGAGSNGGLPGGPFDVEAFENRGQDLAGFRTFGADHCRGGRCVLVEQVSTDPAAQEGCEVADFTYDPPARPEGAPPADQFIQRGTTVTVLVHCPPAAAGSSADGSPAGDSPAGDSPAGDSTAPDSTAPDSGASESSSGGASG